jgi:AcrR family transcriptional regulator
MMCDMERSATAEGVLRGLDPGRPLRSDGQRNRDLVIAAALETFAAHGAMGTVEQIATLAGVSRATVYRSFPTREALQVAVATSQFQQIHWIALEAGRRARGGAALVDFVYGAFEYNQANRLYLELYDGRPTSDMLDVHTASRRTIAGLVDAARTEAIVRDGVTENDVAMFIGGMSVRLARDHGTTQDDWRRIAGLVLRGIGVPSRLLPPRRIPLAHRGLLTPART